MGITARCDTPSTLGIRASRWLFRLCLLLLLAALFVPCALASQATPVGTLRAEVHLLQRGNLSSYYALLSPMFHKTCPFKTFRPTGQKEEQQLRGATLRVLGQRVLGSKAYLTYEFLRGGVVLGKATGDLYVKVGKNWFDEIDKYTTC